MNITQAKGVILNLDHPLAEQKGLSRVSGALYQICGNHGIAWVGSISKSLILEVHEGEHRCPLIINSENQPFARALNEALVAALA